jgi:hypothetical protein
MKYIITESQNNKWWLLRRLDIVNHSFKKAISTINPCGEKSFDTFQNKIYRVFNFYMSQMDNKISDYDEVKFVFIEMFNDKLIEIYDNKEC